MNFKSALLAMRNGSKVKLPTWGGFWEWSNPNKTILMHSRKGGILDIRETKDVEYTLNNILSDDWIYADKENCTLLGGTPTFVFSVAMRYLVRGYMLSRTKWTDGSGIVLDKEFGIAIMEKPDGTHTTYRFTADDIYAEDWTFTGEE